MNITSLVGHTLELIELTDRQPQPADRLTSEFFAARKYLGSRDRRFISEAIFGMIRHRRLLEALFEGYLDGHTENAYLNNAHDRYFPLYVIYALTVNGESAEQVSDQLRMRWKTIFPNLELAEFTTWVKENERLEFLPDDPAIRLGVRYSFQDWMVERWQEEFGDATEALLASLNAPAGITLRVNTRKGSREECRELLRAEGIETEPTRYSPVGLRASKRFNRTASQAFRDGWYEMQDEGSQLVSLLLAPEPGSTVTDACAGAGGKTLHLAEMMNDSGTIIAEDVDEKRLFELHTRATRAGLQSVRTAHTGPGTPIATGVEPSDIVLVDAPCSGSGTIRRNPGFKWTITESLVAHYAERQRALLAANAHRVKTGGQLAYSTCSLFAEENEEIVQSFLAAHPEFSLVPLDENVRAAGIESPGPFLKLTPHIHNTDGFFLALMQKGT